MGILVTECNFVEIEIFLSTYEYISETGIKLTPAHFFSHLFLNEI